MPDLYPTKTRLALLRDIRDGHVIEGPVEPWAGDVWNTARAETGDQARKVTARVHELEDAGWVECGGDLTTWSLTAAGRAVLEAHGGAS